MRPFILRNLVTDGHTQSSVIVFVVASGRKSQYGAGNDSHYDPDDDTDGLGVDRLDMGSGEEGAREGHTPVHTYRHDEEDAHVQVAGEKKPLDFAHSVAKHPVFPLRVVDNQQRQGQHIQQVTHGQVTGQDHASVPVSSLSDHQQPQGEQVSCQGHDELDPIH